MLKTHHLAKTCALFLIPPISGQVTASCEQEHRNGGGGPGSFSFLDSGSRSLAVCDTALWNFSRTGSVLTRDY